MSVSVDDTLFESTFVVVDIRAREGGEAASSGGIAGTGDNARIGRDAGNGNFIASTGIT